MTTRKKTASNPLLTRIARVYSTALHTHQDEQLAKAKLLEFVQKALRKLGASLTAEKLEQKAQGLVHLAIEEAERKLAAEKSPYLNTLTIGDGAEAYTINFFSDIRIPNTDEEKARWQEFLDLLAPKTRIGKDQKTDEIGILFRDGFWLGDLIFKDDVLSLSIIQNVHTIRKNFVARAAQVVNSSFAHEVHIQGDMHINCQLLRQPSPRIELEGELWLYGLRSMHDAQFTLDQLMDWGLRAGGHLHIRSDIFVLQKIEERGIAPRWILEGENILSCYEWTGSTWQYKKRERLSPEAFHHVHSRLQRLCLELGLGSDFIAESISRTPENIDKICLYLDFCRSQTLAKISSESPERQGTNTIIRLLSELRRLFLSSYINEALARSIIKDLTDDDIKSAVAFSALPRRKVSEKKLREDYNWLVRMQDEGCDISEVMPNGLSAGRFLHVTVESDAAIRALHHAMSGLYEKFSSFKDTHKSLSKLSFRRFLEKPTAFLKMLEASCPEKDLPVLQEMERICLELGQTERRQFLRKVSQSMQQAGTDDEKAADDRELLNTLFAVTHCDITEAPVNTLQLLELLSPFLHGVQRYRVELLLKAMREGPDEEYPLTGALTDVYQNLTGTELLDLLRRRSLLMLDIIQMYNSLTASPTAPAPHASSASSLSAETLLAMKNRLERLCLKIGLGRSFLDGHSDALEKNLFKVLTYFEIALGQHIHNETALTGKELELVKTGYRSLSLLHTAVKTGQESTELQDALDHMDNAFFDALAQAFALPRTPLGLKAFRRDVKTLATLLSPSLRLTDLFGHSGRLLLFLNSCLSSKKMKKALSPFLKPVYFSLEHIETTKQAVGLNELLRRNAPHRAAERYFASSPQDEVQQLLAALRDMLDTEPENILNNLVQSVSPKPSAKEVEDLRLINALQSLTGHPLNFLRLDARQTGVLFLLLLSRFGAEQLRQLFEHENFDGVSAGRIAKRLKDELNWHYAIAYKYNMLSTVSEKATE